LVTILVFKGAIAHFYTELSNFFCMFAGYSSYTFAAVKKQFNLKAVKGHLFPNIISIQPSAWLVKTLQLSNQMSVVSEKSRSEWLVAPLMLEVKDKNLDKMNVLSGENLEVDKAQSLTGECDFLFVKDPDTITIETPIFCLVEAERHDLTAGTGPCIAQMIGARLLNERDGFNFPTMYGCVTTGNDWQFLKLENQTITLERDLIYINEIPKLLGLFQAIVDAF
jgi:hypothetical protein